MQRAESVLKSLRLPSPHHLAAARQLWSPPTHSQSFTQAPWREITGGHSEKAGAHRRCDLRTCGGLNQGEVRMTARGPKTAFYHQFKTLDPIYWI